MIENGRRSAGWGGGATIGAEMVMRHSSPVGRGEEMKNAGTWAPREELRWRR